jgi:F-type H+-transporting ATPase subunit epsilon
MAQPTTALYIYSKTGSLFEGAVQVVILPGEDGELAILPDHASIVVGLKRGTVRARTAHGEQSFPIDSGFAYADGKSVIALVAEK